MYLETRHGYVRDLSCKPNIYVPRSISEIRVRLVPGNKLKPSSNYLTDYSKVVFLLWIFFMCLSLLYGLVCVIQPCGHLLGIWLTSWLSPQCICHFPIWYPGSGVVIDCIESRTLPPYLLCIAYTCQTHEAWKLLYHP